MSNQNKIRIKIEISNVIASQYAHFFVLVQQKEQITDKNTKFRTYISMLTSRPKFSKNEFTFSIENHPQIFKFGLMIAKTQLDCDATNALIFGVCSLPFTKHRFLEESKNIYENKLVFVDRGKYVGTFQIRISLFDKYFKLNESGVIFDPLISRVLYNEYCTDQQRLEANVRILEDKLYKIYEELLVSKKEEEFFEKIYTDLYHDEKQLKDYITDLYKINSKIYHRLDSFENLYNLKIEIDMLSQSEEGKKVMIEKLEYFQDRIYRYIYENERLSLEYKKVRPEIEYNLKKAEEHSVKLKGKHMQYFELYNNDKILQSYEDIYYQFKINDQTIKSLSKMSEKSELTAKQAKLLLSQVSYEIKLAEIGVDKHQSEKQHKILKYIYKYISNANKKEEKLSEEENMIYKIKLAALQREIEEVKKKISKVQNC